MAELRLRRRLQLEEPERLRVRMWLFPTLTVLAIATMLSILAAMAFIPEQRWPLVFGIVSALDRAGGLSDSTPLPCAAVREVERDSRGGADHRTKMAWVWMPGRFPVS